MPLANADPGSNTLSYADLPGYSALFSDYVERFERLADYYNVDFRTAEDRRRQIDRTASVERPRRQVADILVDQNRRWQMPQATLDNAAALGEDDSVAIVTGQQVGIFGGALFTLYKTLTTVKLAEVLSGETGRRVVPVFWVEGEDHDFPEIAGISVFSRNEIVDLTYAASPEGNPGPVGRLPLESDIERMIADLDETLPPSDFHDEVMDALRDAYSPGVKIEDAFVQWMHRLVGERGLVYMNPDDRRFKRLCLPLFERELSDPEEASRRVNRAGESLTQQYHAQVHARPTNLFFLDEDGRLPIDYGDGEFALRGTSRTMSREEMMELLKDEPERFSPNVVSRPLMQDYLLPTAFYVAGPGEIAYFAQYRKVCEWANIEMPGIFPRDSFTLIEPKVEKVLDRYDLGVRSFAQGIDALFGEVVKSMSDHDIDDQFAGVLSGIHQSMNGLRPLVESVDRSLVRASEATRASLVKEMERLKERLFRAEKRQHDELRAQLQKAGTNLFPKGKLQERVISPLYYLNKYGFSLVQHIYDGLEVGTRQHSVVRL